MSPEVNEVEDRAVRDALDDYSEALREERPSSDLNTRIDAAIESWATEHRSRSVLRRPLPWVVAAASLAVVAGGIALLASGKKSSANGLDGVAASTSPLPELAVSPLVSPLSTGGQVSLFPADGAVFRVKANLASAAVLKTSGEPSDGERQYWVDVRISNDGTMRIMQVLPAEHGRIVPRE